MKPKTAFLALDGIDAREELEVLHYAQLINTRKLCFPYAPAYPAGRRAALTRLNHPNKLHLIGLPPKQQFHEAATSGYAPSVASGITFEGGTTTQHNVPAGDETATTQFRPPVEIDDDHADEELGETLASTEITANRDSVFQDERQWLGVDDEPSTSRGMRHRKRNTAFSIETVYGEADAAPPAGSGGNRSGGANSNSNSIHITPPNSLSYHRRTNTNNSVANLMAYQANFRLPNM